MTLKFLKTRHPNRTLNSQRSQHTALLHAIGRQELLRYRTRCFASWQASRCRSRNIERLLQAEAGRQVDSWRCAGVGCTCTIVQHTAQLETWSQRKDVDDACSQSHGMAKDDEGKIKRGEAAHATCAASSRGDLKNGLLHQDHQKAKVAKQFQSKLH